jgi:hypothetical protein
MSWRTTSRSSGGEVVGGFEGELEVGVLGPRSCAARPLRRKQQRKLVLTVQRSVILVTSSLADSILNRVLFVFVESVSARRPIKHGASCGNVRLYRGE